MNRIEANDIWQGKPSVVGDMGAQADSAASALDTFIEDKSGFAGQTSPRHALALQVQYDLQYQHDWTSINIHTHSNPSSSSGTNQLSRPLISGLPARHVYIHPDEQVRILKQGLTEKDVPIEREWVLPTHLREKWTLRRFAEVFDAIDETPPDDNAQEERSEERSGYQRARKRGKRLLMAVVNDDSTIVYYIIHDGIIKPRQN